VDFDVCAAGHVEELPFTLVNLLNKLIEDLISSFEQRKTL